jgi:ASC-1-like (ASCH) protein
MVATTEVMPATHVLEFRPQDHANFEQIKSGAKTIECRAWLEPYEQIRHGDHVQLRCGNDCITVRVAGAFRFATPEEMLLFVSFKKIAPWATHESEVLQKIYSYPNYYERIAKGGMLAWEVQVMTQPQTTNTLDRCGSALKVGLKYAVFGTFVALLLTIPRIGFGTVAEVPAAFLTIWALIFFLELIWQTCRKPTQSS